MGHALATGSIYNTVTWLSPSTYILISQDRKLKALVDSKKIPFFVIDVAIHTGTVFESHCELYIY